MSPSPITFELLRFEATPVGPAVAIVELSGAFEGVEPVRPALLVELPGERGRELPAIDAGGVPWSATFAVPLDAVLQPGASFALVPGRGPVIGLPAPTSAAADDDLVRLARTANDLRHRLEEATENAASAAERLTTVSDERDSLAASLEALRADLEAAEASAAEAHESAVAAREEQARAEGEADEARAALARAREEARDAVREEIDAALSAAQAAHAAETAAEERAVAAEDEARAARRDLRDARARIEALVRQARTQRSAAARTRVASRTVEQDEFRAARLGAEWAEGAEEHDAPAASGDTAETVVGDPSATAPLPDDPAAAPLADAATAPLADDPAGAPHADSAAATLSDDAATAASDERLDEEGSASRADSAAGSLGDSGAAAADDSAAAPLSGEDASDDSAPASSNGRPSDPSSTAALPPVEAVASPDSLTEPDHEADPTAVATDLAEDTSEGPSLWSDDETGESVRVLKPRTRAGRRRPAVVVDPDEEILEPAAVGARLLKPAEMSPAQRVMAVLSNPRVIVGGIFLLLIVALVLIFLGVGPV